MKTHTNGPGRAEELLKKLGQKIDSYLAQAKEASGDLGEDFDERMEELKGMRDELEDEIQDLRNRHKDKIKDFGDRFERTTTTLISKIEGIFSRHQKSNP